MRIAVFGAGGRAGRAITAEAVLRGHEVSALVRRVPAHADLSSPAVTVARADVTDPDEVARAVEGCAAVVSAVTPASSPEELARMDPDPGYFGRAAAALLAARPPRLVVIGLFATLERPGGGLVLDDPASFPPPLRPFALSHLAGVRRLQAAGAGVDWAVLTPTAAQLSYPDLAAAVLEEIERPAVHRAVAAVA
ncbi:NAD(P)-dependent oxidoreductase [Dactylosporangium darangshiense]|uniref:NAD(P)-dependent oxidoreductase n=1 Tax=Dactylosporangium darangshiense TaxID=579108 RepID=UPI0031ED7358